MKIIATFQKRPAPRYQPYSRIPVEKKGIVDNPDQNNNSEQSTSGYCYSY